MTAAEEWRRGWGVVLACFVGFSFLSLMTGTVSMFIQPISQEFGWSRTLIASGVSIGAVATTLGSPFAGLLFDRFGPRKLAIPGVTITALSIAAFSFANGSPAQWFALWFVYAFVSLMAKGTLWTAAVANVFDKSRGLALGITFSGSALTSVLLPPLTIWLIDEVGWRMTYVWLGLGWGGMTLLACLFFLYDLRDRPTDSAAAGQPPADVRAAMPGLTLGEAWRNSALWRIGISTVLTMVLTLGLSIHLVPILGAAGVPRGNAAWLLSLAGIAGLLGKLVSGVLLDRFRPNWIGGLTLGMTALAFGLLIDGIRSPTLIVFAMLVNGYTTGTKIQVVSYLTARYGGMRNYGTLVGVMNGAMASGLIVGPVYAGLVFDLTGGYGPFLITGTVGSIICGLLLFSLPAYPDWSGDAAPREPEQPREAIA
ncbi:MFS transporter [Novosphingobium sp. PS1R-30]|uniref:MFS transporter n=1 Tax=Novosphingobium anseongense TaxID=3133436 RepID=A0ABU8RQ35_9SPHN